MLDLLSGIRILDLTTVVLGPYATQMLGDLGAEVTKVEPLAGDVFRAARPGRSDAMGAHFVNLNRNKASLAIDLRHPEGLAALLKLVERADVLVHNMRPASAERLGIGFEAARAANPRIVYCFSSGFGEGGRDADEPAYDDIIQARSGLAYVNADADGEPRFLRTIAADKVSGLHLALAMTSGLIARARTGAAVKIEVPMYEAMVSFLMVEQLAGYSFVPPIGGMGYHRLFSPHRKPYRTADGFIAVMPYNGAHWAAFFRLIGQEAMANDPRVTDPVQRSHKVDELYAMIEAAMPARTTEEWIGALAALDIPCGRVNRLDELIDDGHLADVGLFQPVDHPTEGKMLNVRTPFRSGEGRADRPAPGLGADSRAILREAGYEQAAIDALIGRGIVGDDASR